MYDFVAMDQRYIVFANIFLLANRLQTVMDQSARELTAKQWFLLAVLGLFEQPPTLKQLAAVSDSSHQNTRQLVEKLAEKGFVRIEQDPNDRRAMRIVTTETCQRWNEQNQQFAQQFVERMFRELDTEETAALQAAQQKLYKALGEMKEEWT